MVAFVRASRKFKVLAGLFLVLVTAEVGDDKECLQKGPESGLVSSVCCAPPRLKPKLV